MHPKKILGIFFVFVFVVVVVLFFSFFLRVRSFLSCRILLVPIARRIGYP